MPNDSVCTLDLPRTLIADDQPDVCTALRLLLKNEGFETEIVSSPEAVLNAVAAHDYDLVLMDLNYTRDTTSGAEGLDLLNRLRALDAQLPIVAMTAWGSMELVMAALRQGVTDFILKPWDNMQLLTALRKYQARQRSMRAAQQAQARECADARSLQQNLLPRVLPQAAAYTLAVAWQPLRAVGGDYYDAWQLDEHRLVLCLGDVMGKGFPAALLMTHLQAALHAYSKAEFEPAALCVALNQLVCEATQGARFSTFFCAVYDARTQQLSYTNAGHNAPLWLTADGAVHTLTKGGLPLGAFAGRTYEQGSVRLQRGDRLLLFTDGLTECCDAAGREFGEERLLRLLRAAPSAIAQTLCDSVAQAVQAFSGGSFQDDATWLAFTLR